MLAKLRNQKGFTLIEVVIVLAIAALIILVVFQAVSAAQKSQRDNSRKSEAGRIVSLLEQYASNNGGVYPAENATFGAGNALSAYDDALATKYSDVPACDTTTAQSDDFNVEYVRDGGTRSYTLSVCLEAGNKSKINQ